MKDPEFPTKEYGRCPRPMDSRAVTIPAARATNSGQRDGSFLFAWGTRLSADSWVSVGMVVSPKIP
jgi:hypothetical protein